MSNAPQTLYGSTSDQGCVPSASPDDGAAASGNAGPVYACDGRLVLDESWTAYASKSEAEQKRAQFKNDWLIETWHIWDCCENDWADCNIALYRYDSADLVVREDASGRVCAWVGAIDTQARVLASADKQTNDENYWQWIRA